MPSATGTEARVCADIAARQAHGLAKYGTTVADNPLALREWLQHAYEEALDQAIYLRRAIEELDALSRAEEVRRRVNFLQTMLDEKPNPFS